jgi:murein DD-endopeptidase MepM/ murein hydrolase activator NlpD
MAAEGTPVIAAPTATIEKLFFSGGGGITVYVRSPDQRGCIITPTCQGYAPGLAEGQQVKRGQVIGRVGHTGDASAAGPHLHFAINRWRRASAGGRARRSIPIRCLPGKGQRLGARAGSFQLSQSAEAIP